MSGAAAPAAAIPILLITGFLGAGKTTVINHVLSAPHGRRLSAVVNDFGAINIDAELVSGASEGVFSLKNGCICCSLQGDMLRTIGAILRREPRPEGIVIETSGVSDPGEIVRTLLDPVIWQEAALDAVICVVDARQVLDDPDAAHDPLYRAQIASADFIALNKADQVTPAERDEARARVAALNPRARIFATEYGQVPSEVLFTANLHEAGPPGLAERPRPALSTPRFEAVHWSCESPLSLRRFQSLIEQLSPKLLRAKGILQFHERPGRTMLFQLVGQRATISTTPAPSAGTAAVRVVLIAENGLLDATAVKAMLAACREVI